MPGLPRLEDDILVTRALTKTYRSFRKEAGLAGAVKALVRREHILVPAVKHLDLSVKRGEFIGLLGPNGAGKTTTLKMLTGLIQPTSGATTAFGQFDPAARRPAYLRRIGMVMGQRNQLNPDLPAMDSFRLAQAIYDLSDAAFDKRLKASVELFEVGDKLSLPVRKLSLGERMKMELMLAILHEPELLFLDEPTIGLDFNAARQIRQFLGEANRRLGITVVLTSHYTKDIEELCRRVVVINHGQIVYDGELSGLDPRLMGQKVITLRLHRGADRPLLEAAVATLRREALVEAQAAPASTPSSGDGAAVAVDQLVYTFVAEPQRVAPALQRLLALVSPAMIADLKVTEQPLDEIFGEIYRQGPEAKS